MAFVVELEFVAGGAVGKGDVVVCNVVEEVDFILFQHERGGDRMDRCITPTLVEETAIFVKGGEVVDVGGGPQPVQVADFEIGPLG